MVAVDSNLDCARANRKNLSLAIASLKDSFLHQGETSARGKNDNSSRGLTRKHKIVHPAYTDKTDEIASSSESHEDDFSNFNDIIEEDGHYWSAEVLGDSGSVRAEVLSPPKSTIFKIQDIPVVQKTRSHGVIDLTSPQNYEDGFGAPFLSASGEIISNPSNNCLQELIVDNIGDQKSKASTQHEKVSSKESLQDQSKKFFCDESHRKSDAPFVNVITNKDSAPQLNKRTRTPDKKHLRNVFRPKRLPTSKRMWRPTTGTNVELSGKFAGHFHPPLRNRIDLVSTNSPEKKSAEAYRALCHSYGSTTCNPLQQGPVFCFYDASSGKQSEVWERVQEQPLSQTRRREEKRCNNTTGRILTSARAKYSNVSPGLYSGPSQTVARSRRTPTSPFDSNQLWQAGWNNRSRSRSVSPGYLSDAVLSRKSSLSRRTRSAESHVLRMNFGIVNSPGGMDCHKKTDFAQRGYYKDVQTPESYEDNGFGHVLTEIAGEQMAESCGTAEPQTQHQINIERQAPVKGVDNSINGLIHSRSEKQDERLLSIQFQAPVSSSLYHLSAELVSCEPEKLRPDAESIISACLVEAEVDHLPVHKEHNKSTEPDFADVAPVEPSVAPDEQTRIESRAGDGNDDLFSLIQYVEKELTYSVEDDADEDAEGSKGDKAKQLDAALQDENCTIVVEKTSEVSQSNVEAKDICETVSEPVAAEETAQHLVNDEVEDSSVAGPADGALPDLSSPYRSTEWAVEYGKIPYATESKSSTLTHIPDDLVGSRIEAFDVEANRVRSFCGKADLSRPNTKVESYSENNKQYDEVHQQKCHRDVSYTSAEVPRNSGQGWESQEEEIEDDVSSYTREVLRFTSEHHSTPSKYSEKSGSKQRSSLKRKIINFLSDRTSFRKRSSSGSFPSMEKSAQQQDAQHVSKHQQLATSAVFTVDHPKPELYLELPKHATGGEGAEHRKYSAIEHAVDTHETPNLGLAKGRERDSAKGSSSGRGKGLLARFQGRSEEKKKRTRRCDIFEIDQTWVNKV